MLLPDATMVQRAAANNARLVKEYPKCFTLDKSHTPHITLLQCFVRTADLEKLFAAEEQVLAAANVTALILVGEEVTIADFTSAVTPFGGKVIQTNLDENDVKALKKALNKGK